MTEDQSHFDRLFDEIRNAEDSPSTKDQIIYLLMWLFVTVSAITVVYVAALIIKLAISTI